MKKYLLATVCAFSLALSASAFAQDEPRDETMPPPPPFEQQMEKHHNSMQKELADKLNLKV